VIQVRRRNSVPIYPRRRSLNRGRAIVWAALTLLLIHSASFALPDQTTRYPELPNFHRVNDNLFRGGQPEAGGIKRLREIGVRTVVNLRGEDEQTRAEEAEAKAAGMSYFSIPMSGLGRPTDEQVSRVMAVIESEENWPVFVHCKRGCERTGTIIAIYRVSHDQWTADRALSEAKRLGQSWFAFRMRDYVSDHYRNKDVTNRKAVQPTLQVRGSST
jgi:tyrosine-protein phosphatase SIW14